MMKKVLKKRTCVFTDAEHIRFFFVKAKKTLSRRIELEYEYEKNNERPDPGVLQAAFDLLAV